MQILKLIFTRILLLGGVLDFVLLKLTSPDSRTTLSWETLPSVKCPAKTAPELRRAVHRGVLRQES